MTVAPTDDDSRTYEPRYFAPLFAIEDRHFWFRARNEVIIALAAQVVDAFQEGFNALEVGCGTGNTLRALEPVCSKGHLTGMDLFAEGLSFAKRRVSCPLLQGDIQNSPFRDKFDIIGLFDVLEHLPDDSAVLRNLRSMLRPGGALLLTVPAKQTLWSYFDEAAHHCRRYESPDLESELAEAGFEVEYLSYYMFSLYPMMWLKRKSPARQIERNSRGSCRRRSSNHARPE